MPPPLGSRWRGDRDIEKSRVIKLLRKMACFCPIQVQEGEVGVSMFCGKFVSTPCVLLFAAATPELVQLVYRTEPYHQAATSTVGDISPASNTPRGSDTVRRKIAKTPRIATRRRSRSAPPARPWTDIDTMSVRVRHLPSLTNRDGRLDLLTATVGVPHSLGAPFGVRAEVCESSTGGAA